MSDVNDLLDVIRMLDVICQLKISRLLEVIHIFIIMLACMFGCCVHRLDNCDNNVWIDETTSAGVQTRCYAMLHNQSNACLETHAAKTNLQIIMNAPHRGSRMCGKQNIRQCYIITATHVWRPLLLKQTCR